MSNRNGWRGKALSLLIAWTVVFGGALALTAALSNPARAAPCDQGGGLITGDWTITTTQVCTGITYTVDGSIVINAGGSLTLVNGGLNFSKDAAHQGYALTVNAGGVLILDHSIVTTQRQAIAPYLYLALTVSGAGSQFVMRNGAMLKFPGWFNASSATISITDSTITGFTSSELFGVGAYQDANDDAPVIAWSATTASLYRTQLSRIYENSSASGGGNVTGIVEGNVSLSSGSILYAYDSYIGADYSNILGLHNELQVDATSNAYLYNVTIDRTQDPVLESDWQPAYVPLAAGGTIYLLRWLRATVVDMTGFPVSGATIWSALSPGATTAQYPDNALSTTPSAATLTYLGRTVLGGANPWNTTDANGLAVIPLYTDRITTASLPNAVSFGNYQLAVRFSTLSTSGGVSFSPYPAIDSEDNNQRVTVPFSSLQVRTGPDLALDQADYPAGRTVIQNQPFDIYVLIYNRGQTDATDVSVAVFLDGSRLAEVARVNGLRVDITQTLNQTVRVTGVSAIGAHTLELVVDPDNTINEGGAPQESSNFANITLNVQPPPAGFVAILAPSAGDVVAPGSALGVTGYTRDVGATGISGVSLTIELRSGTTVYASNETMSGTDGFFIGTIVVPATAPDGRYTVTVTPSPTVIQPDTREIVIQRAVPFLNQPVPFLGIPWWLMLIILAIAAAAIIGVTVYFKVYGLGKMVECGECGAFIPEDATTCPKCGVEFEKDMAKCSNCQAWIPVDVKQCPECGIQFATGQLEMADYQEKMRLQYDEVVQKFKEEASRQLGRSLNDREFQDWWRKQPTFLTFEDWLREEEEVRKMGSKACPVCGTLNSVTATVCHKCGSLMKRGEARPPPGGGSVAGAPRARTPTGTALAPGVSPPSEGGAETPPPEGMESAEGMAPAPRRVIPRSAPTAPPVVQKRVVRRQVGEGQQTESTEGGEGQSTDQKKEDEL